MKETKLIMDRKDLTSAEIQSGKNFQQLQTAYAKELALKGSSSATSALTKGIIWSGSVLTSGIVAIALYTYLNKKTVAPETIAQKPVQETSVQPSPLIPQNTPLQASQKNTTEYREFENEETISPVSTIEPAAPSLAVTQVLNRDSLREEIVKLKSDLILLQEKIDLLEKNKSLLPEKPKGYRFRMDVDPKEFPKISKYENILFEVPPEETTFTPDMIGRDWDKGKISNAGDGTFKLTLTQDKKSYSFRVVQVNENNSQADSQKEQLLYKQILESHIAEKHTKETQLRHMEALINQP